jgi:hypothetical protein
MMGHDALFWFEWWCLQWGTVDPGRVAKETDMDISDPESSPYPLEKRKLLLSRNSHFLY